MFFGDYTFFLLVPCLLLAFYAQARVKGTYAKFSRIASSSGISGARMAQEILNIGRRPGGSDRTDARAAQRSLRSEEAGPPPLRRGLRQQLDRRARHRRP